MRMIKLVKRNRQAVLSCLKEVSESVIWLPKSDKDALRWLLNCHRVLSKVIAL